MQRANTVDSTVLNYTASSGNSGMIWSLGLRKTPKAFIYDNLCSGWRVPWLRRLVAGLSFRRHGFSSKLVHVGFVTDKVALWRGFLPVSLLQLSPVSTIPPVLHTHPFIYHWRFVDLATNSAVQCNTKATQALPFGPNARSWMFIVTTDRPVILLPKTNRLLP